MVNYEWKNVWIEKIKSRNYFWKMFQDTNSPMHRRVDVANKWMLAPVVKWICQRAFYMRFDLLPWRFILYLTHRPIDSPFSDTTTPVVMYCSKFTLCVFSAIVCNQIWIRDIWIQHTRKSQRGAKRIWKFRWIMRFGILFDPTVYYMERRRYFI